MQITSFLPLLLIFVALICWIVGEIKNWKIIRRVSAVVALTGSYFIAVFIGDLWQISYNAWYGNASKDLLTALAESASADSKQQKVLLKASEKFQPTWENRARYDEVAREIINDLKSGE